MRGCASTICWSWRALAAGLIALGTAPAIAGAQGHGVRGCSVEGRLDCTLLYRSTGSQRQQRHWPTAVVLWRMPRATTDHMTPAVVARQDSLAKRYRALERAAEDSGWHFMGGRSGNVVQEFAIDSGYRRIRIRDRIFDVPARDSTLVVMVDMTRDSAHTPVIAGQTYVPAELPDDYWTRMWRSGDTTFMVQRRDTGEMLTRLLRTDSLVAAFLDGRS